MLLARDPEARALFTEILARLSHTLSFVSGGRRIRTIDLQGMNLAS